jgi:hypothetical protein
MAVTTYSDFWGNNYAPIKGTTPLRYRLNRLMRRRGMGALQELITELSGTAPGATAAKSYARVGGEVDTMGVLPTLGSLGGSREIETKYLINRATVAADATDIDTVIAARHTPTFPGDLAGNGK